MFYLAIRERAAVGLEGGSVIIAVSFALAVLTYHLVENPVLIEDLPSNTSFLDFSDYFCTEDLCPPTCRSTSTTTT